MRSNTGTCRSIPAEHIPADIDEAWRVLPTGLSAPTGGGERMRAAD